MSVPTSGRNTQTVGTAPTDVIQSMAAIDEAGGSSPAMISPFDTHGSNGRREPDAAPFTRALPRRAQYATASRYRSCPYSRSFPGQTRRKISGSKISKQNDTRLTPISLMAS